MIREGGQPAKGATLLELLELVCSAAARLGAGSPLHVEMSLHGARVIVDVPGPKARGGSHAL